MEDNVINLAQQGANVMSEWGSNDDLDEVHNELLSQLTAMVHFTIVMQPPDQHMMESANMIKCSLVTAYQIGRASIRGE